MENRYQNVRNWLLLKERYEDIVKFDKSDEAKEMFHYEMKWESCTDHTPTIGKEIRLKEYNEIKEEVYKNYHHAIELANEHQGPIHKMIMCLIDSIILKKEIINAQEDIINTIRKYGHPGEG